MLPTGACHWTEADRCLGANKSLCRRLTGWEVSGSSTRGGLEAPAEIYDLAQLTLGRKLNEELAVARDTKASSSTESWQ